MKKNIITLTIAGVLTLSTVAFAASPVVKNAPGATTTVVATTPKVTSNPKTDHQVKVLFETNGCVVQEFYRNGVAYVLATAANANASCALIRQ